jgi:hypothetical protein
MNRRVWVWGGATLLTFLFVWQQLQSVRLGYDIAKTRHMIDEQKERNDYLRLAVERQLAPAELARVARDRLKMSPPSPDAVIVLAPAQEPEGGGLALPNPLKLLRWPGIAFRSTSRWLLAARPPVDATASAFPGAAQ